MRCGRGSDEDECYDVVRTIYNAVQTAEPTTRMSPKTGLLLLLLLAADFSEDLSPNAIRITPAMETTTEMVFRIVTFSPRAITERTNTKMVAAWQCLMRELDISEVNDNNQRGRRFLLYLFDAETRSNGREGKPSYVEIVGREPKDGEGDREPDQLEILPPGVDPYRPCPFLPKN